ncbi:MAG: Gfo/Idh/MocA family oxidoreductase [Bacteroidales bacterium]|nr:Gfo/Idh/MocA family oxidoreductase [Bacteroidales bacterium]
MMKRRKFVGIASAGAAGLALAASCRNQGSESGIDSDSESLNNVVPDYRASIKSSFQAGKTKPAGDKVILALIGAGSWGTNLILEAANSGENILIKYVCDVDDTRGGRAISELEKIQGFRPISVRDIRKVLDDKEVDGVFVETPEHWHALATIWACQAGKDVYVEKTVSHSIYEGQQMIKAAMKYERIVQCGTQNRSADYALTAREYIKSGELGDIIAVHVRELLDGPVPFNEKEDTDAPDTIDWDMWLGPAPKVPYNVSRNKSWIYYWDYSGGPVTSGGSIHQLDMARLILDNPGFPKSVYCAGGRYFFDDKRDIPDYQMATFDYGNFVLTLQTGECTPYFEKEGPEVRYGTIYPKWLQNATRIDIYGTKRMMIVGRMGGGWQVFDKKENIVAQDKGIFPLKAHILNYIDCIRTRKQPNGYIVEGHNSSVMIHLANLSYRAGNKQLLFSPEYETITNDSTAQLLIRKTYRPGYEIKNEV